MELQECSNGKGLVRTVEQKQPDKVCREAKAADDNHQLRVADLRRVDEPLQRLE
jgi:hypothetical protein